MLDTLAIVGVGLLGGSVALAARARGVVRRVLGVVRHDSPCYQGMLDSVFDDVTAEAVRADLILICTPVGAIARLARRCLELNPGAVVSDVGSTKAQIVRDVEAGQGTLVRFVGGHPLAGSEKSGPEHATASLFEGRTTLLTPTSRTDPVALERVRAFWQGLGARVEFIDAAEHDRVLALTSHLPQLVAYTLAGTIPPESYAYAGTGLRDTIRLAGSDPELWADIALSNRESVLAALDRLQGNLQQVREALSARDEPRLIRFFRDARKVRHALGS